MNEKIPQYKFRLYYKNMILCPQKIMSGLLKETNIYDTKSYICSDVYICML